MKNWKDLLPGLSSLSLLRKSIPATPGKSPHRTRAEFVPLLPPCAVRWVLHKIFYRPSFDTSSIKCRHVPRIGSEGKVEEKAIGSLKPFESLREPFFETRKLAIALI